MSDSPRRPSLRRRLGNLGARLGSAVLQAAVRVLPWRRLAIPGNLLGDFLFFVLRARRRHMDENLRTAFGDRRTPAERRRLARASQRSLARTILEFLKSPGLSDEDLREIVSFEGRERFDAAMAQGRGVLLLGAHYGNWELIGALCARSGYAVSVIARDYDDDYTARLMRRAREANGLKVLQRENVAAALRCLRRGEALGILPDQNVTKGGILVPFFGRLATTAPGPALFASRTGAVVLPVFGIRQDDGRIVVRFGQPIPMMDTGDRDADVHANTRRMAEAIEGIILERPEQWLWMHRRWKSAPDGDEPAAMGEREAARVAS